MHGFFVVFLKQKNITHIYVHLRPFSMNDILSVVLLVASVVHVVCQRCDVVMILLFV